MGLDVYLKKYDNKAKSDELEAKHQKLTDEAWDRLQSTPHEYSAEVRRIEKELGFVNGDDPSIHNVRQDHPAYPEHYFKIGYFRSSYNSVGINRKLHENLDTSLAQIMGNLKDEYYFQPDWKESLERAKDVLEKLKKLDAETKYDVIALGNPLAALNPAVDSRAKALEQFQKALAEYPVKNPNGQPASDFSTAHCEVMINAKPTFLALVPGVTKFLGQPYGTLFGIVEAKPGEVWGWYVQAMEIVVATCEYVLAQPDQEKYWLHWSG